MLQSSKYKVVKDLKVKDSQQSKYQKHKANQMGVHAHISAHRNTHMHSMFQVMLR